MRTVSPFLVAVSQIFSHSYKQQSVLQIVMEDDFGADGNDSVHSAGSKSISVAESKNSIREKFKEKDVLKDEIYDSIQEALLGTTILEVPRVSREVIENLDL
jgi:hypothetical protein